MKITQAANLSWLVTFTYTNHKGVIEDRKVGVCRLDYGTTEHHTNAWMFRGYCYSRRAYRSFDLAKITNLKNYKED